MDDAQAEAMKFQLEQALVDLKASQKEQEEKVNNSRRNKRAQKELEEWKAKLSGAAGNVDFEKITKGEYNEQEMEQSMLGIASEIEPTLATKKKPGKFGYDPIRGEKIRLDRPKSKESKTEKKQKKSIEFWN